MCSHQNAVLKGGLYGAAYGLGVSLPGSYLLHKRWPYYRSLPPSLKALGIVGIAVPWCVIEAERQGLAFEQKRWVGEHGYKQLSMDEAREEARWGSLNSKEKITDWASRHRYGIVGGSWAASMAGSFGIIMRNP